MPSSRPIRRTSKATSCKTYDLAPAFAERLRAGARETRFVGTAVPNFFRKPYGPGWALVGDAGYNKDFITAQGIHDAFRDAELCVTALHEDIRRRSLLRRSRWRTTRPVVTRRCCRCVSSRQSSQRWSRLRPSCNSCWQPCAGNQEAMDGFAQVNAGVTSPAEFFSPENVEKIMLAASLVPWEDSERLAC